MPKPRAKEAATEVTSIVAVSLLSNVVFPALRPWTLLIYAVTELAIVLRANETPTDAVKEVELEPEKDIARLAAAAIADTVEVSCADTVKGPET